MKARVYRGNSPIRPRLYPPRMAALSLSLSRSSSRGKADLPKLRFFSSKFPPLSNISQRPITRNLLQTGFQPVTQKRKLTLEKIIPSDISRLLASFDEERLLPAFPFSFRPYVKRKRRERFHHRFRTGSSGRCKRQAKLRVNIYRGAVVAARFGRTNFDDG